MGVDVKMSSSDIERELESESSFLFARPSFLEGLARLIDARGLLNEYNYSASTELADLFATRADWRAVGNDIRRALFRVAKEHAASR